MPAQPANCETDLRFIMVPVVLKLQIRLPVFDRKVSYINLVTIISTISSPLDFDVFALDMFWTSFGTHIFEENLFSVKAGDYFSFGLVCDVNLELVKINIKKSDSVPLISMKNWTRVQFAK